ncbi:MAG: cache domain-containing protein [Candidatus Cloacimonetes bacterium]|nr:cache domain-containing protein [Candidatus Cloacimonadota bacterium]
MKKLNLFIVFVIIFSFLPAENVKTDTNLEEKLIDQSAYAGSPVAAGDEINSYGTPMEAKTLVEDAIVFMHNIELEKAFSEFNQQNGNFHHKDLYIFVFDMDGNMISHGAEESLIGKNLIDLKDSAGKYFVKDFLELMSKSDNGWIEYYWRNYENQKVEMKLTYLKKFNKNLFVGCGAYQPRY